MWLKKSDPYFSGVTDSKAVKGSQNSMSGATTSIVVIITGVATGLVSTVLLICLVAYGKKLRFGSPEPGSESSASSCSQAAPGCVLGASPSLAKSKQRNGSDKRKSSLSAAGVGRDISQVWDVSGTQRSAVAVTISDGSVTAQTAAASMSQHQSTGKTRKRGLIPRSRRSIGQDDPEFSGVNVVLGIILQLLSSIFIPRTEGKVAT